MNDTEVRVRCIEAAAEVRGNPNTLQIAREFYEFATENLKAAEEARIAAETHDGRFDDTQVPTTNATKKGNRK